MEQQSDLWLTYNGSLVLMPWFIGKLIQTFITLNCKNADSGTTPKSLYDPKHWYSEMDQW